jgi:hypothetical protein
MGYGYVIEVYSTAFRRNFKSRDAAEQLAIV